MEEPVTGPHWDKSYTKQFESLLSQVRDGSIPSDFEGGLLFNGRVIRELPVNSFGQRSWVVKSEHYFVDLSKELRKSGLPPMGDEVTVTSPSSHKDAVILKIGKRYRIHAGYWDEAPFGHSRRFYIWKGTIISLGKRKLQ